MNLQNLAEDENVQLREIIRQRIEELGPLPFSEFLQLVLYHPVHGYYVTRDPTLDYKSSPNVHPVFGACIARQIADFWRLLNKPATFTVFEAAAGSGQLASDIVSFLDVEEPELARCLRYVLHDPASQPGEAFTAHGKKTVEGNRFEVATELPASEEIEGCILSNELLDALPFERVHQREGSLLELRTAFEDGHFFDVAQEPSSGILQHFRNLGVELAEGNQAEVNLEAPRWLIRASGALRRGYILTLDYGYRAAELYAPWRRMGTMLTFYHHTSGENPYAHIGRQDITASVDFSSLVSTGRAAGLETIGETSQAEFLVALGIGDAVSQRPGATEIEAYYALRRAAIELTDPADLGRIRVLIQGKNVPSQSPLGLSLTPLSGSF